MHRLFEAVKGSARTRRSSTSSRSAACGSVSSATWSSRTWSSSATCCTCARARGTRDREVVLEDRTRTALDRYLAERAIAGEASTRLFPVQTVTVERMVRHAAEVAQIGRRVTPHMPRHTLATALLTGAAISGTSRSSSGTPPWRRRRSTRTSTPTPSERPTSAPSPSTSRGGGGRRPDRPRREKGPGRRDELEMLFPGRLT